MVPAKIKSRIGKPKTQIQTSVAFVSISRSLRVPAWKTVIVLGAAWAENVSVDDLHVSKSNVAAALTRNWVAWLLTVCLADRVKVALELFSAQFLSPNPKQRPTHLIISSSCLVFA